MIFSMNTENFQTDEQNLFPNIYFSCYHLFI